MSPRVSQYAACVLELFVGVFGCFGQLLTAVDQALQSMADVKAVRWRKREDVKRGVKAEPAAHPISDAP